MIMSIDENAIFIKIETFIFTVNSSRHILEKKSNIEYHRHCVKSIYIYIYNIYIYIYINIYIHRKAISSLEFDQI